MTTELTTATFDEAYKNIRRYPSQGKIEDHDGVPSRPTLARYAAQEVMEQEFDEAVFTDGPLHSETNEVLATIIKIAAEREESVAEIKMAAREEGDEKPSEVLEAWALSALENRYGSWESDDGDYRLGSLNRSGPVLAAIAAVSYGVDPIQAVRDRLGEECDPLPSADESED